jgi:hypothetical protein
MSRAQTFTDPCGCAWRAESDGREHYVEVCDACARAHERALTEYRIPFEDKFPDPTS